MKVNKKENPLVSIVIPVYNAQTFLGYCLNSAMSQTYTNIEVIVVNDGSTDGSLEICRQYEAVDPRFHVFDIPNGGVSHARNFALSKSQGSYFIFLDSDDTLHPQIIERMMEAEEQHQTGLVIGDVQMVDFSTEQVLPTKLTIAHPGTKRLYTKSEFRRFKMSLIWHTALLEGPYCKLFRADLWKDNRIMFPENVSLGEDFLANMRYFNVANGVFFLEKTGYYYNNVQNSTSLSHKFRADIFQNKMMLVDNLRRHLGKFEKLGKNEQECYYNYVASYGLYCVKHILLADGVEKEKKIPLLQSICEHEAFISALGKATYIHPEYASLVEPLCNNQVEKIMNITIKEDVAIQQPKSGLLNRGIRRCLRLLAKVTGKGKLSARVKRLEKMIEDVGLKNTIRWLKSRKTQSLGYAGQVQSAIVAPVQPRSGILNKSIRSFLRLLAKLTGKGKLSAKISRLEKSLEEVGIKNTLKRYKPEDKRVKTKIEQLMAEQQKTQAQIQAIGDMFAAQVAVQQTKIDTLTVELRNVAEKTAGQLSALESAGALHQEKVEGLTDNLQSMAEEMTSQLFALGNEGEKQQERVEALASELRGMAEEMTSQLCALGNEGEKQQERVEALVSELRNMVEKTNYQLDTLGRETMEQQISIKEYWNGTTERINLLDSTWQECFAGMEEKQQNQSQRVIADIKMIENGFAEAIRNSAQDVKDRLWLSECRQNKTLYRLLSNDLRQRRKAVIFGTSEHCNLGDAAIVVAQQEILRRILPDYYQIEYSTYESEERYQFIRSIVNEEDIIFINGGGNLGSLYTEEEQLHRRVIQDFPNNKIIVFPQTIFFDKDEKGETELALSQAVYNKHRDLSIFCRGEKSLAMAREFFPEAHSELLPDCVLSMERDYQLPRNGVLLCLREDGERVSTDEQADQLNKMLSSMQLQIERTNNMAQEDVARENRNKMVDDELRRFASKELVITDRLHGMIFAAITGTPVICVKSAGDKIEELYQAFLKECSNIQFQNEFDAENLKKLIPAMLDKQKQGVCLQDRIDKAIVDSIKR